MLILDGSLSDTSSCVERGYWAFLTALTCLVIFSLIARSLIRLHRSADPDPVQPGTGRLGLYALSGLFVVGLLAVSAVFGIARNRTVLFVENGQLVERGCVKLRPYEDRFSLEETRIEYEFHPKGYHKLRIQPSPTSRTLRVELDFSTHLGDLAVIAPTAMRDYITKLQELDKPIPPALR